MGGGDGEGGGPVLAGEGVERGGLFVQIACILSETEIWEGRWSGVLVEGGAAVLHVLAGRPAYGGVAQRRSSRGGVTEKGTNARHAPCDPPLHVILAFRSR